MMPEEDVFLIGNRSWGAEGPYCQRRLRHCESSKYPPSHVSLPFLCLILANFCTSTSCLLRTMKLCLGSICCVLVEGFSAHLHHQGNFGGNFIIAHSYQTLTRICQSVRVSKSVQDCPRMCQDMS